MPRCHINSKIIPKYACRHLEVFLPETELNLASGSFLGSGLDITGCEEYVSIHWLKYAD